MDQTRRVRVVPMFHNRLFLRSGCTVTVPAVGVESIDAILPLWSVLIPGSIFKTGLSDSLVGEWNFELAVLELVVHFFVQLELH
jgi:hypothetical protein